MLNIAIVHYHLNTGGVTRVIENAVSSLQHHDVNCVVLSGETYNGSILEKTELIPELAYSRPNNLIDGKDVARLMIKAAKKALGAEPDVWHIHNHSLGKNNAMIDIVHHLAQTNAALLLQIHDFAEDGRPQNYANLIKHLSPTTRPYPLASHIHYATLNNRDLQFLQKSAIPSSHLHLLANSVTLAGTPDQIARPDSLKAENLIIYPTRAIRRKNVGEMALFATCAEKGDLFATTLAPENPIARPIHDRWVEFSKSLNLPIRFAIGETLDIPFLSLISMADNLITTSIAEGFGLAFLEPYLLHKALTGRNIPDITTDFTSKGIVLDNLYQKLEIPIDVIGSAELKQALSESMPPFYNAYKKALKKNTLEETYQNMVLDEKVDFGRLNESLQESVIEKVAKSSILKSDINPSSPGSVSPEIVEQNASAIVTHFGQNAYGEKLYILYSMISDSIHDKTLQYASHDDLLTQFLSPSRFNLLRT